MKVTSFGEVLWDDFPNGKVLGGAPLNVAVRLQSLGIDAAIIIRRGDDERRGIAAPGPKQNNTD